jgi:WD40 repeat protein
MTGQERFTLPGLERAVQLVRFSPDGQTLAVGLEGRSSPSVQLWSVSTQQRQSAFTHQGLMSLAFSPDGTMLACGNMGGEVTLWDVAAGQEKSTVSSLGRNQYFRPNPVFALAFSPDSR